MNAARGDRELELRAKAWEINCPVCRRSSWDGKPDDDEGDRCVVCGQLPPEPE